MSFERYSFLSIMCINLYTQINTSKIMAIRPACVCWNSFYSSSFLFFFLLSMWFSFHFSTSLILELLCSKLSSSLSSATLSSSSFDESNWVSVG